MEFHQYTRILCAREILMALYLRAVVASHTAGTLKYLTNYLSLLLLKNPTLILMILCVLHRFCFDKYNILLSKLNLKTKPIMMCIINL